MEATKLKVLFVDGTKGFSPTGLQERPTGGINTSMTLIPLHLSQMGIDCYIKSTYDKDEEVNGVKYLSYKTEAPHNVDIVIFNRNSINHHLLNKIFSRGAKAIWWLHDIVDHRYLDDGAYKRIKNIVSLGDYCSESYSEFYDIPREYFHKIPNGIDPEIWYPGKYEDRDPNLFVYASAPVKGYSAVSFAYYNLKRNNPKARLLIYGNQSLHGLDNTEQFGFWIKSMKEMGAEVHQPIPHKELADVFRKAWILFMPNDYPEMCSNLILQARACGLPIVTTKVGGGPEWVEHEKTGLLTKYFPHDKFLWWHDYTKQVMRLVTDKELHKHISLNSPLDIPIWKHISEEWYNYVQRVNEQAQLIGVR